MIRDPETDFMIKEAFRQKRAVETGKLKLEEATALPEGSRLEGGRVVFPGDTFFSVLAAVLLTPVGAAIAYGAIDGLLRLAASEYSKPTTLSYIAVPLIGLFLGAIFHWVRDQLNSRGYALAEIALGMAAAAQFTRDGDALVRVLAFLAGLRIIVDGISRYLKFSDLQAKRPVH
ncbi:hypothetical protein CDO28_34730 (plasmid) [Sinorhizobium meliloti]|uniref:hypothetical protein n=1 Tax=Rhizobium meliloti TaxID=382 RepID=UPI000B4A4D5E|nr:hypothetical protein [Sinorhizobium meliloti]ASP76515.1 hypothetical protein CDO28_34730 [Sinorhizobium meliloti]MDE3857005.1 hypothetical protein [Sinorhizobium meliloti]MQW48012.1 hypothetical protein [Sinorhizobium meliloti]